MTEKVCTKCGMAKPLSEYWIRRERGTLYAQCKSCMHARHKAWTARNPEKTKEYHVDWIRRSPDGCRSVYREMKRRQRIDPIKRLGMYVRNSVYRGLNGLRKEKPTFDLIGYELEDLRQHIERQFLEGMEWRNYGEWHVDHITPLSSFSPNEIQAAWALSNLRPLWALDNLRKGNKFESR